jgi:choline dehydrogenase
MMPPAAIAGGLNYLFRRKGFLSTTPLPIGGVISTDPDTTTPDVNIVLSTALMGAGPGALRMLPKRHGFAILVRQGAPRSRGEVQLRSAEPSAAPIINAGYLSDPRDLECLKRGIHAAREIARQADLAHLISREIQPGAAAEDDAALTAEIRAKANNVFHAVGTCRLGTDDGSVVDPQLRVRGIEGLRIADTSVLPSLVNAGTYALALMTGERAAAFITGN